MDKTSSFSLPKGDIAMTIIELLEDSELDDISVKELASRAGVNRSTYYRHFIDKEDVVRHFYACLLDDYLATVKEGTDLREYLCGMFRSFAEYKQQLLLLERRSLTYLLLHEMNSRIPQVHGNKSDSLNSLYSNYHIGGVFNSFRYWLSEDMATTPEKLAEMCVSFLPKGFLPFLTTNRRK